MRNEEAQEPVGPLTSTIHTNDPKVSDQLVTGFYGIEGGSWRWTAGRFSALLAAPPGAAQRGATLDLEFTIPEVVIRRLNQVTISASVRGKLLRATGYKQPGTYVYSAGVPPDFLTTSPVRVDFALDKAMPPSGDDKRELGVIVNSIALESR